MFKHYDIASTNLSLYEWDTGHVHRLGGMGEEFFINRFDSPRYPVVINDIVPSVPLTSLLLLILSVSGKQWLTGHQIVWCNGLERGL